MLDESLFVSADVHAREITLPDGKMHTLHFKEVASSEFRRFQIAETSDDVESRIKAPATLIAASLCEADGKPAITIAKAMKLKQPVAKAMIDAILEVNGYAGKKDSPSVEESGSATS